MPSRVTLAFDSLTHGLIKSIPQDGALRQSCTHLRNHGILAGPASAVAQKPIRSFTSSLKLTINSVVIHFNYAVSVLQPLRDTSCNWKFSRLAHIQKHWDFEKANVSEVYWHRMTTQCTDLYSVLYRQLKWLKYFRRDKVYASGKLYKTSISVNRGLHVQVHFVRKCGKVINRPLLNL